MSHRPSLGPPLAGTTLVVISCLLLSTVAMAIEEPSHRIVESFPEFELRAYAPYLVAETTVEAGFDKAGDRAFRILADYIFGNNSGERKIEMTAPVNQQPAAPKGTKIEMTAPVTQEPTSLGRGGAERHVLSFVMPARFTLETLPAPKDSRVTLREQPARLMAVRRYSGRWTEANYRREEAALLAALGSRGYRTVGTPVYARYNSPFSLPFMRRNEVMVEVEQRR